MKMNRYTLCMAAAALFAVLALTGCSLLKVAVATGDPLSKEEMNIRTMTRGFYYDMASEVSRTADSIAAAAPDIATRVAAVRWKIRATRAGVSAAMQGIPDVALADMWILCRRMDEGFAAAPDSLLFGAQSDLARDAAARLDRRAARLARQVLAVDRYGLMERFVADYVRENPADGEMEGSNTTLAWIEFLRANGIEHAYATGSIAEVLADVNDRLSGQTQQVTNSVSWSKDIFEMRLRQDSLRLQVGAQLDSLERSFNRIVVVAEHLPEISDKVLEELNRDYVTGARARGVREGVILRGSVLRCAMLTILTLLALSVGSLLGGTAIIESIFQWDGVGKLAVDAITMRDYPMIQAYVVWMAVIYVAVNLVTDLLYHALDPRIRLGVSRE